MLNLLSPREILFFDRKTKQRYSREKEETLIKRLRYHYQQCIEFEMSDYEAAQTIIARHLGKHLISFRFAIDCMKESEFQEIYKGALAEKDLFEFDDDELVKHIAEIFGAVLRKETYQPDRISKLDAFAMTADDLQKADPLVSPLFAAEPVTPPIEVVRKCLLDALRFFAGSKKINNAELLYMYAGLENWSGRFSPENPFTYRLFSFYLQNAF